MIQLIAGFKAIHSEIPKMKFGVQDVIASNSLDKSLNSSIQLKRKWVTNTGKQTARDLEFSTRRI